MTQAEGATTDDDGSLYVTDNTGDELWRINPANPSDDSGDFGLLGAFPSGLSSPYSLAAISLLPDAEAPTLAVSAPDVDEGGTSQITVTPSGGTYDDLTTEYEIVSGGGSVNATGLITTPAGFRRRDADLPR